MLQGYVGRILRQISKVILLLCLWLYNGEISQFLLLMFSFPPEGIYYKFPIIFLLNIQRILLVI